MSYLIDNLVQEVLDIISARKDDTDPEQPKLIVKEEADGEVYKDSEFLHEIVTESVNFTQLTALIAVLFTISLVMTIISCRRRRRPRVSGYLTNDGLSSRRLAQKGPCISCSSKATNKESNNQSKTVMSEGTSVDGPSSKSKITSNSEHNGPPQLLASTDSNSQLPCLPTTITEDVSTDKQEELDASKDSTDIKNRHQSKKRRVTPRKTQQSFLKSSPKQLPVTIKQNRHYYVFPSPRKKTTEPPKSSVSFKINSSYVDLTKGRWRGGAIARKTSIKRRHLSQSNMPVSLRMHATQNNDLQKHRTHSTSCQYRNSNVIKSLSISPALRKETSHQLHKSSTSDRFNNFGIGESRLTRRSKIQIVHEGVSKDKVSYKIVSEKEKESFKMKMDWPTYFRASDELITHYRAKSPIRDKTSKKKALLPSNKKALEQKKNKSSKNKKRCSKKHARERNKGKVNKSPAKESIESKPYGGSSILYFPEPCRVGPSTSNVDDDRKISSNISFSLKRTATPVLSSLFGQGAFRTCWPKKSRKEEDLLLDNEPDNENTGRHNTIFFGPNLQDINNDTTDTNNLYKMKHTTMRDHFSHLCSYSQKCQECNIGGIKDQMYVPESDQCLGNKVFVFPKKEIGDKLDNKLVWKNAFNQNVMKSDDKSTYTHNETVSAHNGNIHVYNENIFAEKKTTARNEINDKIVTEQQMHRGSYMSVNAKRKTGIFELTHRLSKSTNLQGCCQQLCCTHHSHVKRNEEMTTEDTLKEHPNIMISHKTQSYEPCEYNRRKVYTDHNRIPFGEDNRKDIINYNDENGDFENHVFKKLSNSQTNKKDLADDDHERDHASKNQFFRASLWPQFPAYGQISTHRDNAMTRIQLTTNRQIGQTKLETEDQDIGQKKAFLKNQSQKEAFAKDDDQFHQYQNFNNECKANISKDEHVFSVTKGRAMPLLSRRNCCKTKSTNSLAKRRILHRSSCQQNDFQTEYFNAKIPYYSNQVTENDTRSQENFAVGATNANIKPKGKIHLHDLKHSLKSEANGIVQKSEMNELRLNINADHKHLDSVNAQHLRDCVNSNSSVGFVKQRQTTEKQSRADLACRCNDMKLNQSNSFMPYISDPFSKDSVQEGIRYLVKKDKYDQTKSSNISAGLSMGIKTSFRKPLFFLKNTLLVNSEKDQPGKLGDPKWSTDDQSVAKTSSSTSSTIQRGHSVKKSKSLISLSNMLQELTSQVCGNQAKNRQKISMHNKKPVIRRILYFKPKNLNNKHHFNLTKYHLMGKEKPQLRDKYDTKKDLISLDTSDSYATNSNYVNCYRLKRSKHIRHEPYIRPPSSSSCSENEPVISHLCRRNKNNCSPSRTGRYVLGPIVDEHVFLGDERESAVNDSQATTLNVSTLHNSQHDKMRDVATTVKRATATEASGNLHLNTDPGFSNPCNGLEIKTVADYTNRIKSDSACTDRHFQHTEIKAPKDSREIKNEFSFNKNNTYFRRKSAFEGQNIEGETARLKMDQQFEGEGKLQEQPEDPISKRNFGNSLQNSSSSCRRSVIQREQTVSAKQLSDVQYKTIWQPNVEYPADEPNMKKLNRKGTDAGGELVGQKPLLKQLVNRQNVTGPTNPHKESGYLSKVDHKTDLRTLGHTDLIQQETSPDIIADNNTERYQENGVGTNQSLCAYFRNSLHHEKTIMSTELKKMCNDEDRNFLFIASSSKSEETLKSGSRKNNKCENFQKRLYTQHNVDDRSQKTADGTRKASVGRCGFDESALLEVDDSVSKTALQNKVHRIASNRLNLAKNILACAKMKSVRRHQQLKNNPSPQMDTNITCSPNQSNFNNVSGVGKQRRKDLGFIPTTQSDTTQTDNHINAVHASVQTSPFLQVLQKKTSFNLNVKRCFPKTKLLRHKERQKEHLLYRYRFLRRASTSNLPNTMGFNFSWGNTTKQNEQENTINNCSYYLDLNETKSGKVNVDPNACNNQVLSIVDIANKQTVDNLMIKDRIQNDENKGQKKFKLNEKNPYMKCEQVPCNVKDPILKNQQNVHTMEEKCTSNESTIEHKEKLKSKEDEKNKITNKSTSIVTHCRTYTAFTDSSKLFECEPKTSNKLNVKQESKSSFENTKDYISQATPADEIVHNNAVKSDQHEEEPPDASVSSTTNKLEMSESSSLTSRLSDLKKYCTVRPVWKNANVEEIDRRVNRALRLREVLKQSASSGEPVRSIIASYFEASSGETPINSSIWTNSGNAPTKETLEKPSAKALGIDTSSQENANRDKCVCPGVQNKLDKSQRDPSSEGEHTSYDGTECGFRMASSTVTTTTNTTVWSSLELKNSSGTIVNQNSRKKSLNNETRFSTTKKSSSNHEITTKGTKIRIQRRTSDQTSSHTTSNTSTENSAFQNGRRHKNSPPTKMSKVENAAGSIPRLISSLVQTLPQVPLSSFVEWFIETSDPNNYVSSHKSSNSSDNSQSNSTCFAPLTAISVNDQSISISQATFCNEPRENIECFSKRNVNHTTCTSSSRKTQLEEKNIFSNSEKMSKSQNSISKVLVTTTNTETWPGHQMQSNVSATQRKPSTTSYAVSCSSERVDQESPTETDQTSLDRATITSHNIKREHSILNKRPDIKSGLKVVSTKFNYNRKNSEHLSAKKSNTKYNKFQKRETTTHSYTPVRSNCIAREKSQKKISKSNEKCSSQTNEQRSKLESCTTNFKSEVSEVDNDCASFSIETENMKRDGTKFNKTQRGDSANFLMKECARTQNKQFETNEPCVNPINVNAHNQGWSESKLTTEYITYPDFVKRCEENLTETLDNNDGNRCAPGIRHILMKLRQNCDVDDVAAGRRDRMKITLRKSSDVTGIVAKFQNKHSQ